MRTHFQLRAGRLDEVEGEVVREQPLTVSVEGLDRRERTDGASPLVEDWASPHLDYYAGRQVYWRASPSLAQLLPATGEDPAR